MKFISGIACLLFAFSSFGQGWEPVPEEDIGLLSEPYTNVYYRGCMDFEVISEGRSFQNSEGKWIDEKEVKQCTRYCRPLRNEDPLASITCKIYVHNNDERMEQMSDECKGVGNTYQEAKEDALSVCRYLVRRYRNREGFRLQEVCVPQRVCFNLQYRRNLWNGASIILQGRKTYVPLGFRQ